MRTIGSPNLHLLDSFAPGQLSRVDLAEARVLQAVVRQALAHPERPSIDVVAMDEYTHDVVIRIARDLVLVFDST